MGVSQQPSGQGIACCKRYERSIVERPLRSNFGLFARSCLHVPSASNASTSTHIQARRCKGWLSTLEHKKYSWFLLCRVSTLFPWQLVVNRVHLHFFAEAEASDEDDELDGKVEKILAPAKGSIDVENRRFVVKFHNRSYRAAKAVSESVLMQHCPQLLRNYLVKVRLIGGSAAD